MGKRKMILCLLYALCITAFCRAQGFLTASARDEISIFVPAVDNICLLDFPAETGGHRVGKDSTLKPPVAEESITGRYVTLECDFRLSGPFTSDLIIEFPNGPEYKRIITLDSAWLYEEWQGKAQAHCGVEAPFQIPLRNGYFLAKFDPAAWHCLAVSFTKDDVMIFLDNYFLWGIGRCNMGEKVDEKFEGYLPSTFIIKSTSGTSIRNVRYAQSGYIPVRKKLQVSPFNTILTGAKLITYRVLFDVNSAIIRDESLPYVDSIARWMTRNPAVKLEVSGHTDNDGDAAANTVLSQRRAAAIVERLGLFGIDSNRLEAKGYGEEMPLQSNATKEGKAANRRVELRKL